MVSRCRALNGVRVPTGVDWPRPSRAFRGAGGGASGPLPPLHGLALRVNEMGSPEGS